MTPDPIDREASRLALLKEADHAANGSHGREVIQIFAHRVEASNPTLPDLRGEDRECVEAARVESTWDAASTAIMWVWVGLGVVVAAVLWAMGKS